MNKHDVVVIGGSRGSYQPLSDILSALPRALGAAVFVVTHVPAKGGGLHSLLTPGRFSLPASVAVDGEVIAPGHIYFAPPDSHLILRPGAIRLGQGPRENLVRPAIDALFRSAALAFGSRVIAVVLSGMMNDGAAGISAIKTCGGLATAQSDADFNEMPLAASRATNLDYWLPAQELGNLLPDLVMEAAGAAVLPPSELELEVAIAADWAVSTRPLAGIGTAAPLTCPQCESVLYQVNSAGPQRYRCQLGHGYTADVLLFTKGKEVLAGLRLALRVMQERGELMRRLADDAASKGNITSSTLYMERRDEYLSHVATLRAALVASGDQAAPDPALDES